MMSLVRVINGPVANAGSMFILFSNNGNAVPKIEANRMTVNRDMVTVIGMARLSILKQRHSTKIMEEQMVAFRSPPPTSFRMFWKIFFTPSALDANPLTTIAEDWIPTFPPMAVMTGINMAVAGNRAMSAS